MPYLFTMNDHACCSRSKQPTMPEHKKMAENTLTATSESESEATITQSTENEQTQSELTNETKSWGFA